MARATHRLFEFDNEKEPESESFAGAAQSDVFDNYPTRAHIPVLEGTEV